MKTGIEFLTRKMMSQPLIQVATLRRADQKKRRSRHHFDVATWKRDGKKEISCNVELRPQPEEKKWKAKEVATSPGGRDIKLKVMKTRKPSTELRPRNQSHNMKSSYKQQGGRNLKLMSQHRRWKNRKTMM